jgi:hypothetical protein
MRLAWLSIVFPLGLGLAACAPRQNRTHYDRWDSERASAASAPAEERAPKDAKGPSVVERAAEPRPAAEPRRSGQALMRETPDVGATSTATRSRVIRPVEPAKASEDEAIY